MHFVGRDAYGCMNFAVLILFARCAWRHALQLQSE